MSRTIIVINSKQLLAPFSCNGVDFCYRGLKCGKVIDKKKFSIKQGTDFLIELDSVVKVTEHGIMIDDELCRVKKIIVSQEVRELDSQEVIMLTGKFSKDFLLKLRGLLETESKVFMEIKKVEDLELKDFYCLKKL